MSREALGRRRILDRGAQLTIVRKRLAEARSRMVALWKRVMASVKHNMMLFTHIRMAAALYADEPREPGSVLLLTTTTLLEKCGDSYVVRAISSSVTPETTENSSRERPITFMTRPPEGY